jgi:hypothetical protein
MIFLAQNFYLRRFKLMLRVAIKTKQNDFIVSCCDANYNRHFHSTRCKECRYTRKQDDITRVMHD